MKIVFIIVAIFAAILAVSEGPTPYGIGIGSITLICLVITTIK